MAMPFDKVQDIKDDYIKQYMDTAPYDQYINGCGISKLKVKQNLENITLKKGESLDDLCLSVLCGKQPPQNLNLPSEYQGVRVFYEVVGDINIF